MGRWGEREITIFTLIPTVYEDGGVGEEVAKMGLCLNPILPLTLKLLPTPHR